MNKKLIENLYQAWNQDDPKKFDDLISEWYTIFSDPGDGWEGKTLDKDTYKTRVQFSRKAFPDLKFSVSQLIEEGDRVAVVWSAEGTQLGDLPGIPATKKKLTFAGQTVYQIKNGKVSGHWQTMDRLGLFMQTRS
ncbi:ester cyclase [Bdellovibrio sp. NC01]|uniref:ester cyclase n=1 Tax=Bdellovibrio sp. NC01 TaxID=2220073 RepID=UPI001157072B|nr:ester cyclase [Bdellovibrio sp. NC01]QDK39400.1 hypothetical protein DOE51_18260 [Bdellovibrio sp. NC01]